MYAKLDEFPDYRIYTDGSIFSERSNRNLKPGISKKGYLVLTLQKNGKRKTFKLHRLLAMCFMPCNCDFKDITVDHINRDKLDNSLFNLRWASHLIQQQNRTGECIYLSKYGTFQFQKVIDGVTYFKSFKTYEEAVAFRDNFRYHAECWGHLE
jgi:hypothetical protein